MENTIMINGVRSVLTAQQTLAVLEALYGKTPTTPKNPIAVKKVAKKRKGFFARRWTETELADVERIKTLGVGDKSQAIRDFARQAGRTTQAVSIKVYKKPHPITITSDTF